MKSLIIDTHSEKLFFALDVEDIIHTKEKISKQSHSEIAIPTLIELLEEANITLNDLDEIIVVNGPGSFTGVRIGVTIAKTLAYSLNIKIKTITSLEAYGLSAKKEDLVVIKDTKGYYSAKIENQQFKDFEYRKTAEFDEYVTRNNYKFFETDKIDIEKLIKYIANKENVNPHAVNPIYIKEIDVTK